MAVREVLRIGNPLLRRSAVPVENFGGAALDVLIGDMLETMDACNGAGLAAPQVGVSSRVVVFGVEQNPRYPDAPPVPLTILVNPVITPLGEDIEEGWEGCLSVPGMRGLVPRHTRVGYRGFDPAGNLVEREADGFHARVVQHECDHLDGVLYPDRIRDMRMFGFIDELQAAGQLGDLVLPEE